MIYSNTDTAVLLTLLVFVLSYVLTYHHLSLGLVTSPILADQVLERVDARVSAVCRNIGLVYTRYVDDITISGGFDFSKSGLPDILNEVLLQDGFDTNRTKEVFGRFSAGVSITGLSEVNDRLDVRREYISELYRQIEDAGNLASGRSFTGPYYSRDQILGRIHFVLWIKPSHRSSLIKHFRCVAWHLAKINAVQMGYVETKKRTQRIVSLQ